MPVPSTPSVFRPAAVHCCRCNGTKSLSDKVCSNPKCLHRNCPNCEWIDDSGDDVRHPIQIPTTWSCGTCFAIHGSQGYGGNHVVQLLRKQVWCPCNVASTKNTGTKKKPVEVAVPAKRATLAAIYDQFGTLMHTPETPIEVNTPEGANEAAELLWTMRGSYWLPEIEKPGSMLRARDPEGYDELEPGNPRAFPAYPYRGTKSFPRSGRSKAGNTSAQSSKAKPAPKKKNHFALAEEPTAEEDAAWALKEAEWNEKMAKAAEECQRARDTAAKASE